MSISQTDRPLNHKLVELVVILAIFVAGFAGGAYVSRTVFDSVPHVEDEISYLFQAKVFAKGMVYAPSPEYSWFFDLPFVVNYQGKWFGKYTPGYPMVLAVGVLVGSPSLVNPVLGGLSAVLIYLLGRSLYSRAVGLLGAALCLSSPMFLLQSGSFMAHPATLFFGLVFFLSFLKVYRGGSFAFAVLAGVALGMAFLSRPLTGVALGLPFLVFGLADSWRRGFGVFRKYFLAAMAFAIVAALLPLFNYALTGNPFFNTYELWWSFDKIGFGSEFGVAGHTFVNGLENTADNLSALAEDLFGWPFYLSLIFLPVPLLLQRNRWDWLLLAVFLTMVTLYSSYWATGIMYGPRYYFEAIPALVLLSARGLVILGNLLKSGFQKFRLSSSLSLGMPLVLIATTGMIGFNLADFLPSQMAFYHDWYGINGNNLRLVKGAGIHNAIVFVTQDNSWEEYGSVASAVEPTLDSDVVFAIDRGTYNINLMDEYPGREYYRLRQGTLEKLGPN